jgi:hypothetical protein
MSQNEIKITASTSTTGNGTHEAFFTIVKEVDLDPRGEDGTDPGWHLPRRTHRTECRSSRRHRLACPASGID